ncbi:MAG: exonuclease SbcCD subunit D C-terminal domain-containing protein [Deltaproteobacteria bacterium]|jgi:exonuclease SbcD|nr:exonuclease SbcCD subunit D C-terminal domain-containing protein [Deltaproteobacteria bacterium]
MTDQLSPPNSPEKSQDPPLVTQEPKSPESIFQATSEKPSLKGSPIRILHASDWHLGRTLNRIRRRHEEQALFLDWLIEVINEAQIDVLLVAGDIFDSATPPVASQELYYDFLVKAQKTPLKDLVITAGNHDSAAFLMAPAKLLKYFNVHVVADPETLEEEILVLNDQDKQPYLVVAAAPFLKDRFLRIAQEGETIQDKDRALVQGLIAHYAAIAELALAKQMEAGGQIPIVGLGHLFARGGQIAEGDGVRDLYAGSLCQIPAEALPKAFDYLALGHLHRPQKVGRETIRYSGSPLMMSFAENEAKSLAIVTLGGGQVKIELLPIPVFQELKRLKGTKLELIEALEKLKKADSQAWLELVHTGEEFLSNPRGLFEEVLKGSRMELIAIIDERIEREIFGQAQPVKSLAEMSVTEVFERLLDRQGVKEEERPELLASYQEIVLTLAESGQSLD